MQQHPEFINSLVALKNYYQAQIEEYQRQVAHATEQLNHVDALLDDQMARQYKQQQRSRLSETETVFDKSEIAPEVDFDNPVVAPEVDPNTSAIASEVDFDNKVIASETAFDKRAITSVSVPPKTPLREAVESASLESTILNRQKSTEDSNTLQSTQPLVSETKGELTSESLASPAPPVKATESESIPEKLSPVQAPDTQEPTLEPTEPAVSKSVATDPVGKSASDLTDERSLPQRLEPPVTNGKNQAPYVPPPKTPLLPQYQHFTTKSEAVEKFLQDNEGKNFSIDEITRAIHGDLEPEAIRAERSRMNATLNKGVAKGFWSAVPNARNHYTIDLKSVEPIAIQPEPIPKVSSKPSRRSKYSDSMRSRYRQLSFTEAVATVVQENAGQVLTPKQVTRELYGDVPAKELTKAQAQVTKALWAGAKQKRWQQVPGQLGQYTLDLKRVNKE